MQTCDETTHSACKFCVNRENILELRHAANKAAKPARTCKNYKTCFVLPFTSWQHRAFSNKILILYLLVYT